jgi:hypothetical protein
MRIKVRVGRRCWLPFHWFKLVYSDTETFYYQCRACKTRRVIHQGPYDKEKFDWEWIRYETENEKPFMGKK